MPALRVLAAFLILACPRPSAAQEADSTQRLADLGRVWGYVKFHHPHLAYANPIDWDSALVQTIPLVGRARTPGEYRAAIGHLLERLGDPLTKIVEPSDPGGPVVPDAEGLTHRLTEDSILLVRARNYYALSDESSQAALRAIQAILPSARAVIFDLRADRPVEAFGRFQLAATLNPLERRLSTQDLHPPGERYRVFYGYPGTSAFSSGQYRTGFFTRFAASSRPARGARGLPSVFVLNGNAPPPASALAFQARGTGLIVFDGDAKAAAADGVRRVEIGDRLVVDVRVSEMIHPDGTSAELIADVVIPASGRMRGDVALDSAFSLARRFSPSRVRRRVLPAVADVPVEAAYAAMEYPALEYRLLGLFRLWSTIHYFYPYKHLLEQNWDSTLSEFLPRFQQAADAQAYNRAIAELATRLHDSHAYVAGNVYNRVLLGEGYPPLRVRIIEGQPVIAAIPDSATANSGLQVGDVVIAIDGEEALARLGRWQELISASTRQSARDKAALSFMNGPVGSRVRLRVRGDGGNEREVSVIRRREDYTTLYHHERSGAVIQVLPGNIGYADLDRLGFAMVDSMFRHLRDTKAIILDMRGYPNGTAWAIAPRLSTEGKPAALLETPLVGHDSPAAASETFYQLTPASASPGDRYAGRTIMLMDERTQSQAEHTGLFLRAANGTMFVGSPTAGANGEVTTLVLPGAVTVGFTGQSVRHPDGSQLQRVGLIPDMVVHPTIQGIREGRDEVLEAALRVLGQPPEGPPNR